MKTGFKYLLIKALKFGITFLGIFLVIISVFICFAANDKITPENLNSKNKLYLSLRYKVLTTLFRNNEPIYHRDYLPKFEFFLTKNDLNFIKKQTILIKTNLDKYRKTNKWRQGILKFNGDFYSISWKIHGKSPKNQISLPIPSINIKLNRKELIYNSNKFSLIIYNRLCRDVNSIEYVANCFNLPVRKHPLVNVRINNGNNELFYFEPRYDSHFMKNYNHQNLIRLKSTIEDKSYISDGYISKSIRTKNIIKKLNKTNFSKNVKIQIIKSYNNLNNCITSFNSDSISKFFDNENLTNFMAARLISGCNSHGLYRSNFYLFFDTLSNKFYTCFNRDEKTSILKNDSIEFHMHKFIVNDIQTLPPFKPYFTTTVLMNDTLRQIHYKKAYKFISKNEYNFHYDLQKEYNKREKMHFPEWIKSCDGLTHLIAKPYFDTNATILKNYLSKSEPIINIKTTDSKISLDIKPQSNAALRFKSFTIKNTSNVKFECGSINLKITSYSTDEPKKVSSLNAKVNLNNGELNISNEMSKYFHCDGLDNNLLPFKRTYIYKIQLDTNFILNSSNIKIDYELVNIVTNQIVKL